MRLELRMIRFDLQVGKKQRLSAGFMAAAIRFDGDEYGINLSQPLGVIEFQYPAFLRGIVHVKDPQIERLLRVWAAPSPRLKGSSILQPSLLIQIIGVEDQRLSPRIKHPAVGLLGRPGFADIVHLSDIEIAGAHELANIPVVGEQFLLLVNCDFLLMQLLGERTDFGFERVGAGYVLSRLLLERIELLLEGVGFALRLRKSLRQLRSLLALIPGSCTLRGRFTIKALLCCYCLPQRRCRLFQFAP